MIRNKIGRQGKPAVNEVQRAPQQRSLRERLLATGLGVSLALGAAACSEQRSAQAVGWAVTQEGAVYEKAWLYHGRETSVPQDRPVRNVDSYVRQTGSMCLSRNEDGACTISMPTYTTFYEYDAYEDSLVRPCFAPKVFSEFVNKVVQTYEACLSNLAPGQWPVLEPADYRVLFRVPGVEQPCEEVVDLATFVRLGEERSVLLEIAQFDECRVLDIKFPVSTTASPVTTAAA